MNAKYRLLSGLMLQGACSIQLSARKKTTSGIPIFAKEEAEKPVRQCRVQPQVPTLQSCGPPGGL